MREKYALENTYVAKPPDGGSLHFFTLYFCFFLMYGVKSEENPPPDLLILEKARE